MLNNFDGFIKKAFSDEEFTGLETHELRQLHKLDPAFTAQHLNFIQKCKTPVALGFSMVAGATVGSGVSMLRFAFEGVTSGPLQTLANSTTLFAAGAVMCLASHLPTQIAAIKMQKRFRGPQ